MTFENLYRQEEYIFNQNWPWFYTINAELHGQKHKPQIIIKRNTMKTPRSRPVAFNKPEQQARR